MLSIALPEDKFICDDLSEEEFQTILQHDSQQKVIERHLICCHVNRERSNIAPTDDNRSHNVIEDSQEEFDNLITEEEYLGIEM